MASAGRRRHLMKIIVLGDSGVGKTSLLVRYVKNQFSSGYKATIGADFLSHEVEVDNTLGTLQIWDTAGQERFQGLGNAFFRGSDAFVLVYDVTNPKTFENLEHWRQAFFEQSGIPDSGDFPCVLLGNKVDRTEERVVSAKRADEWARQHQCPHFEVSAKEATNVEKAFYELARIVLQNVKEDAIDEIPTETVTFKKEQDGGGCPC